MKALTSDWIAGYQRLYPPEARVAKKTKQVQWAKIRAALDNVTESGQPKPSAHAKDHEAR